MKHIENSDGQSTIEFILTFSFTLSILFVFVKVAFTFVEGYVVHYATFQASRAYLVYDNGSRLPAGADDKAFSTAKTIFSKYIKKNTSNLSHNAPGAAGNKNIYTGIWFEYNDQFTSSKVIGGDQKLRLRSESFLGREPTIGTCVDRTCAAMMYSGLNGECGNHTTFFDNGC